LWISDGFLGRRHGRFRGFHSLLSLVFFASALKRRLDIAYKLLRLQRSQYLQFRELLPRFVEPWLVTLDESHIFVVPPVLEVKIFDPRRQLVLSLRILFELEWSRESMFCKTALHRRDILKKATFLSVLSLPLAKSLPFAHLWSKHLPDPPLSVVIDKLPIRQNLAVFSGIL
jgi:hypothetical protein